MIFVLGGLAGAVFYLPFKRVKNWAWESYWLVYAVFGLVVVPWVARRCDVAERDRRACGRPRPRNWLLLPLRRHVGRRRTHLGTDDPLLGRRPRAGHRLRPVFRRRHAHPADDPRHVSPALTRLPARSRSAACFVSLLGIVLVGGAGMSKESELPDEVKKAAVAEYNFKLGLLVAIFSGLMSSGMNFGLHGGATIEKLACDVDPRDQRHVERHARVGCGARGRIRGQRRMVPRISTLKNRTAGDYVKGKVPLLGQLLLCRIGRRDLVLAVHLPEDRRAGDGQRLLHRLGGAHGQHDPLQHDPRHCLGRVAEHEPPHPRLLAAGLLFLAASAAISAISGYLKQ